MEIILSDNETVSPKKRNKTKKRPNVYRCLCTICSTPFLSPDKRSKTCKPKCQRTHAKNRRREARHRRRLREIAAGKTTPVREMGARATRTQRALKAIVARDGGNCALCGTVVDFAVQDGLAPNAPSLDHIVPRSLGGSSRIQNLQLAHRDCNIRRGNKDVNVVVATVQP
jgi:5-methylcytosine-specific restriction endonuclease McrA